MIIEIPLGGEIRKIKWDGKQFHPLNKSGVALAFCTKFGNAVAYLVKDVANTDEFVNKKFKEDTLTLTQFVNRFERILDEIKNLSPEDFNIDQNNDESVPEGGVSITYTEEEDDAEPVEDEFDGL